MGLFIIFGIAFLGWLMWSGKGAKESFLTFAWVAMAAICLLQIAGLLL